MVRTRWLALGFLVWMLVGCGQASVPTVPPDLAAKHMRYLATDDRTVVGQPRLIDVTGDGTPEYIYLTYYQSLVDLGVTGAKDIWSATIFSGAIAIFDDGAYWVTTIDAVSGNKGFQITGSKTGVTNGQSVYQFLWDGARFIPTDGSVAVPPAVPAPAGGSIQNYPTAVPAVAGGAGQDIPRNWYAWNGLPVPGYFVKGAEARTRYPTSKDESDPLICTTVTFKHGLSNVETIRKDIQLEWQRQGLTFQRIPGLRGDYNDRYVDAAGKEVFLGWNSMHGATITDCR